MHVWDQEVGAFAIFEDGIQYFVLGQDHTSTHGSDGHPTIVLFQLTVVLANTGKE